MADHPLATALLTGMFDDASLFPPAAAPMEAVLGLHAASGASPWGRARGRLLLPLGALPRYAQERRLLGRSEPVELGVIVGSPADPTATSPLPQVADAVARLAAQDPSTTVAHVEYRPADTSADAVVASGRELTVLADELGVDQVFLEVVAVSPSAMRASVDAVADLRRQDDRLAAKLRFGGLTPDLFPKDAVVASFLRACHDRGVPFKGTAGLHHAWYDDGDHPHHGWLAVVLAVHAVARGGDDAEVLLRLRRGTADGVRVTPDALVTPDDRLDVDAVIEVRRSFVGFGTCSFTEPLAAFLDLPGAQLQ